MAALQAAGAVAVAHYFHKRLNKLKESYKMPTERHYTAIIAHLLTLLFAIDLSHTGLFTYIVNVKTQSTAASFV